MRVMIQGKRYQVRQSIKRGTCDLCDFMEDCSRIVKEEGYFPCYGLEPNAYLKLVKEKEETL